MSNSTLDDNTLTNYINNPNNIPLPLDGTSFSSQNIHLTIPQIKKIIDSYNNQYSGPSWSQPTRTISLLEDSEENFFEKDSDEENFFEEDFEETFSRKDSGVYFYVYTWHTQLGKTTFTLEVVTRGSNNNTDNVYQVIIKNNRKEVEVNQISLFRNAGLALGAIGALVGCYYLYKSYFSK